MAAKKLPLHLRCRYEVIRTIKASKDSRIDLCYDLLNRDKVIIARFKKKYFHVSIQRLKELQNLQHSNLVKIRSAFHEGKRIIIVMDFVYGKKLSEILNESKVLNKGTLETWCAEIKETITFLHDQKPIGLLHGDIKAENIMIDNQNRAVLIDFSCMKENCGILYRNLKATRVYSSDDVLNFGIYDANSDWHSYKIMEEKCFKKI